jgi:hypothetical protein
MFKFGEPAKIWFWSLKMENPASEPKYAQNHCFCNRKWSSTQCESKRSENVNMIAPQQQKHHVSELNAQTPLGRPSFKSTKSENKNTGATHGALGRPRALSGMDER